MLPAEDVLYPLYDRVSLALAAAWGWDDSAAIAQLCWQPVSRSAVLFWLSRGDDLELFAAQTALRGIEIDRALSVTKQVLEDAGLLD
jgi:hypothetical protein